MEGMNTHNKQPRTADKGQSQCWGSLGNLDRKNIRMLRNVVQSVWSERILWNDLSSSK
jgi:hypothetical protein